MEATRLPFSSPEKPNHLQYLRDYRVEACVQFKQHQCQQHRPYTCFNWHFANQRRRRPVLRADGTFNYSADIYCDKYDENTGICPDGDSCGFLHRVAGDVERKYHLRYYKTALCVHPTDARGVCSKNGVHCAFAHSAQDLRHPLYDVQEAQNGSLLDVENRDRTSFVIEDPLWHDQVHVLSCYKTEQCRKPARLCRQGYACPFYHNSKDRRRPPAVYKYRSTPCPAAKSADEWLEPEQCENGDDCGYCHTRTEQQFHPEIYKSTKCNDMLEHGYCPRAVFCAFAHHDSELHVQRTPYHKTADDSSASVPLKPLNSAESSMSPCSRTDSASANQPLTLPSAGNNPTYSSVLKHRQCTMKSAASNGSDDAQSSGSYPRAPGYERVQISPQRATDSAIGRIRTSSLNMGQLDLGFSVAGENLVSSLPSFSALSNMSRTAPDTTIRGLPSAIDELCLDDLSSSALSPISERREHKLLPDLFSNTPISSSSSPMQIPGSGSPFGSSPLTSIGDSIVLHHKGTTEATQPSALSKSAITPYSIAPPTEATKSEFATTQIEFMSREELQRELRKKGEELQAHHQKLAAWEEGLKQARQACEAWKKDAEFHRRVAELAEAEKVKAIYEKEQALMQVEMLKRELRMAGNTRAQSPFELPHFTSISSFAAFAPAEGEEQDCGGGPVCARCGREKRADSRNTSCRLCCS